MAADLENGFQRAYRTVYSARGGSISDVPSLLWLARRFHRYYDRSSWPDIHAVLQRLIGIPGLEDLRAALVCLETCYRGGRKGLHCPERCICNSSRHAACAVMSSTASADVCYSGRTPTPSAAALVAHRRPDCSWYGPQLEHSPAHRLMLARATWCPLSPASSDCRARLVYLLKTHAHSIGPGQKPDAWRGGSPPQRPDPYQFQSVCTTGHRDGLKSTRKGRMLPASSAAVSHAATAPHIRHRWRITTSMSVRVLLPLIQDACPRRPYSMPGRRPPSVRTPGKRNTTSRAHRMPSQTGGSSCPHRPAPYAVCTTSSFLVSLPCSAPLGHNQRRAVPGTWTAWTETGSDFNTDTAGKMRQGRSQTPPRGGLDLGRRTRSRPWARRLPSRSTRCRRGLRRTKRRAARWTSYYSLPCAWYREVALRTLMALISAAILLLSPVVVCLFLQPDPHNGFKSLEPSSPLLSPDSSTRTHARCSSASTQRSLPGPKSGGRPHRPMNLPVCRIVLRLALLSTQLWGLAGVRVGETVANSPEVTSLALQRPHSAAKPRAPVLTDSAVPPCLATDNRVQKRSYARFLRRLATYGKATYRGQTYTRPPGPVPATESTAPPQDPGSTPGVAPTSHRWRIVSWNAGGLSQPKLEELFLWLQLEALQGRPVHIMTVQETHWSFTSEWQSQGHWLIHSSLEKPTRSAGVLQILRQDFVSTQQVRTAHVVPGRLVHTRLATEPPISLITVYQHCWSTNSTQTPTQDKLLEVREQLWTQLHRLVGSIAQRHQLVIAGDFNTPCLAMEDRPHLVRAAVKLDRSAPTQKDHGRLQSLLRDHSLAAVSSFGRTAAAATYLSGSGPKTIKTRIDFVLCRPSI